MNIADRIQLLRKAKGISQEELAQRIGVSRQAVSKWESEQSLPDIDKIVLLSDYFETTADYLLKGIEPKKESRRDAAVFALSGTVLNVIALVACTALWFETQKAYSTALGLALMAAGTGVFLMGQRRSANGQEKAKRAFFKINVWVLSFIPLSCGFNLISGWLGGFYGLPAPVPMMGNSAAAFAFFWAFYIGLCTAADVFIVKKKEI